MILGNAFMEDRLYRDYAIAKSWSQSVSRAPPEDQKSLDLFKANLRKEYDNKIRRVSEQLHIQRSITQQRHQQEIDDLQNKLSRKKERVRKLKKKFGELKEAQEEELKNQKDTHEDELGNLKAVYKEKIKIINKNHQSTIIELKDSNKKLFSENNELQQILLELKKDLTDLKEQRDGLEKDTDILNKEIVNKDSFIHSLQQNNDYMAEKLKEKKIPDLD